jgi:hypothetical protein
MIDRDREAEILADIEIQEYRRKQANAPESVPPLTSMPRVARESAQAAPPTTALAALAADLFMCWTADQGLYLVSEEQADVLARAFIGGYLTGRPDIRMPWEPEKSPASGDLPRKCKGLPAVSPSAGSPSACPHAHTPAQILVLRPGDVPADTLEQLDQAVRLKQPHRLPDRRPRDAELVSEQPDVEPPARRIHTVTDPL